MSRHLAVISLVCLLLGVAMTEDCKNPLLSRTDIQTRYGGSSNILSTPAAASNDIAICSYLKGKDVCVNSAGYTALKADLQAQKDNIVSIGQTFNAQFSNLSSLINTNTNDCIDNLIAFVSFISFSASASVSGSSTIDYTSLAASLSASLDSIRSQMFGSSNIQASLDAVNAVRLNITTDKARCAKHLMEYYLYVSCEASDANYANKVQGTSDSPVIRIKKGYCATVASDCKAYISGMKLLAEAQALYGVCANSQVAQVGNLFLHTTFSADVNTQLNSLWASIKTDSSLTTFTSVLGSGSATLGSNIQCSYLDGTNSCNFMCDNVFNGVNFKANAFTQLSTTATNRLLDSSGSFQEVDDSSLDSPDTATSGDDTSVQSEGSVIGGGSSNGKFLAAGLGLLATLVSFMAL